MNKINDKDIQFEQFLVLNFSDVDERGQPKMQIMIASEAIGFIAEAATKGVKVAVYTIGACVADIS